VRDGGCGEVDLWSRGDRRREEGEVEIGGGDTGAGAVGVGGRSTTGDESSVRSSVSTFGDADRAVIAMGSGDVRSRVSAVGDSDLGFAATSCGDVRSRQSASGGADMVLLRRGEVRRGRDGPNTSLTLFFLLDVEAVDDAEFVDACDAFDDIDVNGGRVVDMFEVGSALVLALC